MADYYPLIARAIAGLDPSAPGESRRVLYERARTALIAQLRGVQPPLSESEITRERLSLEEAVRKVESEAVQRARDASRSGDTSRGSGARTGDALRATTRQSARLAEPTASVATSQPPLRPQPPSPPSRNDRPRLGQEDRSQRSLRPDTAPPRSPQPPRLPIQEPQLSPTRERTSATLRRGPDNNAVQANRATRKAYTKVPSPPPEYDRFEPVMENRGADPDASYFNDESVDEAGRYVPSPQAPRSRVTADHEPRKRARSSTVFPFKSAIAIGVVLILVGAAILWGKSAVITLSSLFKSSSRVVETSKNISPAVKPKISDRVGQPSSSDQVAPVAQRVVLYDEDPSDPKGKLYVGSVIWRTEQIKAAAGQKPDIAVRADIEIPERKFKMTMSFRRNTDTSLPASHTAELTFILPPDFAGGGIGNVPGILMKSNEQARGTPLAGLAVKVTDGFFLVGLSNADADRQRNLPLLKERSWFDVPLVYANQRRAIIAIEKGSPGERAFNDAFAAWGE